MLLRLIPHPIFHDLRRSREGMAAIAEGEAAATAAAPPGEFRTDPPPLLPETLPSKGLRSPPRASTSGDPGDRGDLLRPEDFDLKNRKISHLPLPKWGSLGASRACDAADPGPPAAAPLPAWSVPEWRLFLVFFPVRSRAGDVVFVYLHMGAAGRRVYM